METIREEPCSINNVVMSPGLPVGSLAYSAVPARRRRRETERKRRETERQRGERRWINHQMIATKEKGGRLK